MTIRCLDNLKKFCKRHLATAFLIILCGYEFHRLNNEETEFEMFDVYLI